MKSVFKFFAAIVVAVIFSACTTKPVTGKDYSEKRSVAQVGAGSGGSGDIDSNEFETGAFGASVIRYVKVASFECSPLSNISHEEKQGGKATFLTDKNKKLEMQIRISRWTDGEAEHKELCTDLKKYSKSQAKIDVIFRRDYDYENKPFLVVLGIKLLAGLSEPQ